MKKCRGGIALLLLFASFRGWSLDDFRTRVAVLPMRNLTNDERYDYICSTVTETVSLAFQLLGKYLVVSWEEDSELSKLDSSKLENIAAFSEKSKYDEVLFGEAARDPARGLVLRLSLFNRGEGKVRYSSEAEVPSILDIFDASDRITVGMLSQVSDMHIGFGALDVRNRTGSGVYTVFLNGQKIRNPKAMLKKVLNGTYSISIHQDRLLGDTVIYERSVDVFEDGTAVVEFEIPRATPAEIAYMEEKKKGILDAAKNPEALETLIRSLADFQKKVGNVDYDPRLKEIREEVLSAAGTQAGAMLQTAMKEADGKYYSFFPDFNAARTSYERFSRLVNNPFDLSSVTGPSDPIANPTRVRIAADRTVYVLDGTIGSRILAVSGGKTEREAAVRRSSGGIPGSFCLDRSGNVYYAHPQERVIGVYNRALEKVRDIAIPEYEPSEDASLRIAVSDENVFYLVSTDKAWVFASGGERERNIEESLLKAFRGVAGFRVSDALFDENGLLNVFSGAARRVLRFDTLGDLQSEAAFEKAEEESGLDVDDMGYFYATLPGEHRVVKCTSGGETVTSFGKYGIQAGEYSSPRGVAVDPDGTVYVADTLNNRVQILVPTAPPVLLPEVARIGVAFEKRSETATEAIRSIQLTRDTMNYAGLSFQLGSAILLFGAGLGAGYFSADCTAASETAYAQYLLATDPATVGSLRMQATQSWIQSRVLNLGVLAGFGLGSLFLFSGIITLTDYLTAEPERVAQLQGFSMDETYVLDVSRYRSLRAAQEVGAWTGVVTPLLGASAAVAAVLTANSMTDPLMVPGIVAASVAVPPIMSHLYAGKLHLGLLTAGLVSDALAGAALWLTATRPADWAPVELPFAFPAALSFLTVNATRAWKSIQSMLPVCAMVTALGVRVAAGAYDASLGWVEAKENNLYRARMKADPQKAAEAVPSVSVGPEGVRVAVSVRW